MQYCRHTYSQTYLFTPCHHLVLLLVTGNQCICYDCSLVSVVENMSPSVVSCFFLLFMLAVPMGMILEIQHICFRCCPVLLWQRMVCPTLKTTHSMMRMKMTKIPCLVCYTCISPTININRSKGDVYSHHMVVDWLVVGIQKMSNDLLPHFTWMKWKLSALEQYQLQMFL